SVTPHVNGERFLELSRLVRKLRVGNPFALCLANWHSSGDWQGCVGKSDTRSKSVQTPHLQKTSDGVFETGVSSQADVLPGQFAATVQSRVVKADGLPWYC